MENNRLKAILLFSVLSFSSLPYFVLGYEPHSTHRALTREVCYFYNTSFGTPWLTEADCDRLMQGAMEEDNDFRMAHHFYDPIYGVGLKGYTSSKMWAEDPMYQANWDINIPGNRLVSELFTGKNDHSWQRAIYEYVYGDKERALVSLGHILHLIEDASVPDHTRNDAHIPIFDDSIAQYVGEEYRQKSPFEGFSDRFSIEAGNVKTAYELQSEGLAPVLASTLGEYFDKAARYSNENFFSKSTINSVDYSLPTVDTEKIIQSEEGNIKLGYFLDKPVIRIRDEKDPVTSIIIKQYILDSPGDYLLSSYWSRTSRSAVQHGAGVVALFFQEVEKEKQTGKILKMKDPLLKQAGMKYVDTVKLVGSWGRGAVITFIAYAEGGGKYLANEIAGGVSKIASRFGERGVLNSPIHFSDAERERTAKEHISSVVTSPTPVPALVSSKNNSDLSELIRSIAIAEQMLQEYLAQVGRVTPPKGEVLGSSVGLVSIGNSNLSVSAEVFATTAPFEPHSMLQNPSVTTASTTVGTTTPTATLPDPSATSTIDLVPPLAPIVQTPGEATSTHATTTLTFSGEGEATTTLVVLVSSTSPMVVSIPVTTTGTWTFDIDLWEGTTTILFTLTDDAGNISSTTERTIIIDLVDPIILPSIIPIAENVLVINEIAWGGTLSSTEDEWIEILNRTSDPVELSDLRIRSEDGSLILPLSGTIPANGYTVVAANSGVFSGHSPDVSASFGDGLSDLGEGLILEQVDSAGNVVGIIDMLTRCDFWCGKGAATGITMTRPYGGTVGNTADDWETSLEGQTDVLDRNGEYVPGTPWGDPLPSVSF